MYNAFVHIEYIVNIMSDHRESVCKHNIEARNMNYSLYYDIVNIC